MKKIVLLLVNIFLSQLLLAQESYAEENGVFYRVKKDTLLTGFPYELKSKKLLYLYTERFLADTQKLFIPNRGILGLVFGKNSLVIKNYRANNHTVSQGEPVLFVKKSMVLNRYALTVLLINSIFLTMFYFAIKNEAEEKREIEYSNVFGYSMFSIVAGFILGYALMQGWDFLFSDYHIDYDYRTGNLLYFFIPPIVLHMLVLIPQAFFLKGKYSSEKIIFT